jgi:integrase
MARVVHKSKFPGVRYREHPTRKNGIKPDRYFFIRYKLDGKDKEEGLGWSSEGMTETKAAARLSELREAHRTGQGARTLAEKREAALAVRQAQAAADAVLAIENVTFADAWSKYLSVARANKRPHTAYAEEALFRLWVGPVLAQKRLTEIAPIHLEKIKKTLADASRSAQTIRHALAMIRQVFNYARANGLYQGDNPTLLVKKPTADAKRIRFLTPEEASRLLEALAERSPDVHNMALLALNAGLRAGEVFSLTWADVDFDHDLISLRDTKSGKTRQVPLTSEARAMLEARKAAKNGAALVFPPSKTAKPKEQPEPSRAPANEKIVQISETFNRVVAALGLNDDIEDPRQKVVFHTLRHTFASWLVQRGVPLVTVARLLGHATTAMTERYSHLAPDHFKQAVDTLESVRSEKVKNGKVVHLNGEQ